MKTKFYRLAATALAAAALLGACKDEAPATQSQPLPTADASTPDRALKSYWSLLDWINANNHAVRKINRQSKDYKESAAALKQLAVPRIAGENEESYEAPLYVYSREIVTANVETESRAVVMATIKNVTPLAAGVQLDPKDQERREKGTPYKYVLEKDNTGWKVAEVWEAGSYPYRMQPSESKLHPVWVGFGGY